MLSRDRAEYSLMIKTHSLELKGLVCLSPICDDQFSDQWYTLPETVHRINT